MQGRHVRLTVAAVLVLVSLLGVSAQGTDPLASSSNGCFNGWIGAWTFVPGCTCEGTCRTCSKGDGSEAPTANDCLACEPTDTHTVVNTADNSGTCTVAAELASSSVLQCGAVVSAFLAFVVALASA